MPKDLTFLVAEEIHIKMLELEVLLLRAQLEDKFPHCINNPNCIYNSTRINRSTGAGLHRPGLENQNE
jgi:hypothetical protein